MGGLRAESGRVFVIRVDHDADIIHYLTEFAKKNNIELAHFTAIGALKVAKLGFYDQIKHTYLEETISTPAELASCVGNISIKDEEPFVHAHSVLAGANGEVRAGHLLAGKVFAAEVHLVELKGSRIERKPDAVTGLSLWQI